MKNTKKLILGLLIFISASIYSCSKDGAQIEESLQVERLESRTGANFSYVGSNYLGTTASQYNLIGQNHNYILEQVKNDFKAKNGSGSEAFFLNINKALKDVISQNNISNVSPSDSLTLLQAHNDIIWVQLNDYSWYTSLQNHITNKTFIQIDFMQSQGLISSKGKKVLDNIFQKIKSNQPINLDSTYLELNGINASSMDYAIISGTLAVYEYSNYYWKNVSDNGDPDVPQAIWPALAGADAVGFVGGCYAWAAEEIYTGNNSTSVTACLRNGLWGAAYTSSMGWIKW